MLGYVLYGEVTERGSRKFLNVLVRIQKEGVAICKRTDQKKFYRNTHFFEDETEFLSQNPQKLAELLEGKTVYI
jgi:hypothetical protein